MARVFVTRSLPGGALGRLSAAHDTEVWPDRLPPPRDELLAGAGRAEGLLSLLTDPVDAELIAACPELRAISNYAVGVDNVDLEAATARAIPVGNTPGVLTESTADLALALILGIARRLVEGEAFVRAGKWVTWEPDLLLGRDLHDATVGIVGLGRIGRAVASRLDGFGCEVLAASRSGGVRARGAARALGLRDPPLPAHARDARADRHGGPAPDEAHGLSREHGPRPDRRHARARGCASTQGRSPARRST